MPLLILGVYAYLVALPFLVHTNAAYALVALTAAFVLLPRRAADGPDPGWGFLLPLLPFAASLICAVLRAPDEVVASAVATFMLPGLVMLSIIMRNPGWPVSYWLVAFSLFSATISGDVLGGWVILQFSHANAAMLSIPEAPLMHAGNQLLLVPNDICVTAVLLFCQFTLLADRAQPRLIRGFALLTILLAGLAMAILRTRTGILVAVAELAVASLAWPRLWLWALPVGGVMALADHFAGFQMVDKVLFSNTADNHGVAGRLGLWASAWTMFTTAPLFGHGAQAFGLEHGDLLPSWSPRFPEKRTMWAHSLYLETLADQGLTGAATLALIFYKPARNLCVLSVQGLRKGYINHAGVFALAGLVGFLVAAGFELSFIRRWVPLVMFGLIGLALRVTARHDPAPAMPVKTG